MILVLATIALGVIPFSGIFLLAENGIRNGDRPGDARVTAEARLSGHPEERRPMLIAEIQNPSAGPAVTGLTARRAVAPEWLAPGDVTVPLRTIRRGLRPGAYDTIGVVPAFETARLAVPVDRAARRYRLTVAVGQRDARLRLHRIVVTAPPLPSAPAPRRLRSSGRG